MAIVVHAVFKIGSKALKNGVMVSLSAISFIAIFFFNVPFPIVVIAAALIGFLGGKVMEDKFYVIKGHAAKKANEEAAFIERAIQTRKPNHRRSVLTALPWHGDRKSVGSG